MPALWQYSTLIYNGSSTALVPWLPVVALHQKVLFAVQPSLISTFEAFTTKFTESGSLSVQAGAGGSSGGLYKSSAKNH